MDFTMEKSFDFIEAESKAYRRWGLLVEETSGVSAEAERDVRNYDDGQSEVSQVVHQPVNGSLAFPNVAELGA